jgi:rhamnosyl/mannosyltransferase
VTRVLHIGKFYPPVSGGMERVVQTMCRVTEGAVRNRVLVTHTSMRTSEEVVDGIPVTRVGTIGAAGSVHIAPDFARWLRQPDADVLVLHEPNPWALLSFAIARPRVPLVLWYHSDVVRPRLQYAAFYAPLARFVYGRARRVAVSSGALAQHASALGPWRDRVAVVPFGIDVEPWQPTADLAREAARIRQDVGASFVLHAGRMVPYKGVDVLLRALAGTHIHAVIVGDGPRRDAWQQLARDLGVDRQVRFSGEVPQAQLAALFHACDAFVLPSITRAEAFGYVQLEAMACGKPVVSTDLPTGVPWVNRHGETGLVVPPADPEALRRAITTLLEDAALRTRLGDAGRRRIAEEFSLEMFRVRLLQLYGEALAA